MAKTVEGLQDTTPCNPYGKTKGSQDPHDINEGDHSPPKLRDFVTMGKPRSTSWGKKQPPMTPILLETIGDVTPLEDHATLPSRNCFLVGNVGEISGVRAQPTLKSSKL